MSDLSSKQFAEKLLKIELHRHMAGSVRFSTLQEFLPEEAKSTSRSDEESTRDYFCVTEQKQDLKEVLDRFIHVQSLFVSEEFTERIAFEIVEDAVNDNIIALELRYSPGFIVSARNNLTLEQVHQAVIRGLNKARKQFGEKISVGLIGILGRDLSDEQAVIEMEFILKHKEDFIGVDLANDEKTWPLNIFPKSFQKAKQAGLGVTIHCGEVNHDDAPQWVQNAVVQCGATRIGHGVFVTKSESIMAQLKAQGVVFEVSISSNVITNCCESASTHPIKVMKDKLIVTLNSDDPGLFDLSLSDEILIALEKTGLTKKEIVQFQQNALQGSFFDKETKEKIAEKLKENEKLL